jgi:hypothetical protein
MYPPVFFILNNSFSFLPVELVLININGLLGDVSTNFQHTCVNVLNIREKWI